MKPDLRITDPDDFEKVIARQCMTLGYEVVMPTKNNPGYDIELISKISSEVNIPVIASGGVGNLDHLVDGIKFGNASAVLAASIFHYGKHSIKEAKEYLD